MGLNRITPDELDALVGVMRKHGVYSLQDNGLTVLLGPEPVRTAAPRQAPPAEVSSNPDNPAPVPSPDGPATTDDGVTIPQQLVGKVDPADPLYSHLA